jgi:hypothetical protein
MTDSEIKSFGNGGTAFVGKDAVRLYQATALASALRLYAKTKMQVNRMYTPSAMLKAATAVTGKAYKRGQHQQAADDLKLWADEMAAALPKSKAD